MKLWPDTLLRRNVLLLVGVVVLGQLAAALTARDLLVRPRMEQMADGIARTAQGLRAGLAALPPEARAGFVQRFNDANASDDAPAEEPLFLRGALGRLDREMVRAVSSRLAAQGGDILWRRESGGGLALRLALDGVDHWVVLPGVLPGRQVTGAWAAATLAGALIALGGALLIQRLVNRPLARLQAAARSLARGEVPAPLPEDGPDEIATVGRSFNQMTHSLQRAERERALMLAGVSHDLRTPLAKLRLAAEILREPAGPELAANMQRSIAEMDGIVGQFLDFARDDAAEAPIEADLADLVADVAAALGDQGRAVAFEAHPAPARVRPALLRRALVNLAENAWTHGRPPVVLRSGAEGAQAWVEVEDHGAGIAAADAERLRQPFARGEPARGGDAPKGAGLGLAIVERAARAHGGRLELLRGASGGLRARIVLGASPA